ncbi:hypothetical protein BT67DRAFT_370796, partial [Trichocladium antarcticum]
ELVLVGEMDAAWREECGVLRRRLEEWRGKLGELDGGGQVGGESNLDRIVAGCCALVHGMLAELEVMEQIAREAAAEEMRWVRAMNRRGRGGADQDGPRAGAIWRAL